MLPRYSGIQLGNVAGSAAVATGWTRDPGPPAVVRLTTSTDQVAIGTATPTTGRKLTILTTGTDQGIRVTTTAGTDTVLDTLVVADTVARFTILGTGAVTWGGGAAAQDVRLLRTGAGTLQIDNAAGGAAALVVVGSEQVQVQDAATSGVTTLLKLTHTATGLSGSGIGAGLAFAAADSLGVPQNASQIAGVLTTVTAGAVTGAINFYTRTGGAALTLRMQLTGPGVLVTQGRQVATSFNLAAAGPYTVDSGATLDDFVGMDTTTGAQAILLPAAVTGRRLTCKNTALVAVVNLAQVTPNGVETIDGVAGVLGLTGTQVVTLTGRTGVGWYVS